jgi:hypothetical protein
VPVGTRIRHELVFSSTDRPCTSRLIVASEANNRTSCALPTCAYAGIPRPGGNGVSEMGSVVEAVCTLVVGCDDGVAVALGDDPHDATSSVSAATPAAVTITLRVEPKIPLAFT